VVSVFDVLSLTTDHRQDSPVAEHEDEQRPDVEQQELRDEPDGLVRAIRQALTLDAYAADDFRRRPRRYEVRAGAEDPRNDDSDARHPRTIVVAVGDRVDDLDVAFDGDDHQAADGRVAGRRRDRKRLETPADEHRQRVVRPGRPYHETEEKKCAGGEIEDGLVGDEHVDVAGT